MCPHQAHSESDQILTGISQHMWKIIVWVSSPTFLQRFDKATMAFWPHLQTHEVWAQWEPKPSRTAFFISMQAIQKLSRLRWAQPTLECPFAHSCKHHSFSLDASVKGTQSCVFSLGVNMFCTRKKSDSFWGHSMLRNVPSRIGDASRNQAFSESLLVTWGEQARTYDNHPQTWIAKPQGCTYVKLLSNAQRLDLFLLHHSRMTRFDWVGKYCEIICHYMGQICKGSYLSIFIQYVHGMFCNACFVLYLFSACAVNNSMTSCFFVLKCPPHNISRAPGTFARNVSMVLIQVELRQLALWVHTYAFDNNFSFPSHQEAYSRCGRQCSCVSNPVNGTLDVIWSTLLPSTR